MNRRQFVRTLGQGSLAAYMGFRSMHLWGQKQQPPTNCAPPTPTGSPTHITFDTSIPILPRKSAFSLSTTEAKRLKAAYAALRKLTITSPNDPRGWMQQAHVHCNYC